MVTAVLSVSARPPPVVFRREVGSPGTPQPRVPFLPKCAGTSPAATWPLSSHQLFSRGSGYAATRESHVWEVPTLFPCGQPPPPPPPRQRPRPPGGDGGLLVAVPSPASRVPPSAGPGATDAREKGSSSSRSAQRRPPGSSRPRQDGDSSPARGASALHLRPGWWRRPGAATT
jgi:hypothetical protein